MSKNLPPIYGDIGVRFEKYDTLRTLLLPLTEN